MIEYKLITGRELGFTQQLEQHLSKGYVPHGNVVVAAYTDHPTDKRETLNYSLMMVKEEKKLPEKTEIKVGSRVEILLEDGIFDNDLNKINFGEVGVIVEINTIPCNYPYGIKFSNKNILWFTIDGKYHVDLNTPTIKFLTGEQNEH